VTVDRQARGSDLLIIRRTTSLRIDSAGQKYRISISPDADQVNFMAAGCVLPEETPVRLATYGTNWV
jgi:hypothetical protein